MHPAQSKVLRRWFFLVVGLIAIVILLLRFLVLPSGPDAADWQLTSAAALDNLLAATLTSLIAGIAYVLYFPPEPYRPLEMIASRDISDLIERAARESDRWEVRARTASYFTRVTLPVLKNRALQKGTSVTIKVLTLDPRNDAVLEAYARFRSNHPGSSWTVDRARTEILSTILAAAVYSNEAPRLTIEVALSPSSWMLSLDISDRFIFVTGQNKGDPCLCIGRDSDLYLQWRDEFDATYQGSTVLKPSLAGVKLAELSSPSPALITNVGQFFIDLGMPPQTDDAVKNIISFRTRKHNYA